ncbi:Nitrate reductase molybdenum cofactor assembly chaperone NarJ [compost metagenome]
MLFDLLLVLSASGVAANSLQPQVAGETRDDTPQALDAVWEEEQIKFLGEQGCASAQQATHQRRFTGAVAPQYLDVGSMTTATKGR